MVEPLDESVESGNTDLKCECTEESKHGTPYPREMSTPLKLVDYVEDEEMAPKDTRNQDQADDEGTKARQNKGLLGFFQSIFSKVRIHLHVDANG